MNRRKRVKTAEDWHPTSGDDTVEVSLHKDKGGGPNLWRVSVWGEDDFGLELGGLDIDKAFKVFRSVKAQTTKTQLKSKGFTQA